MVSDRTNLSYLVYSRQKTQCAKIVTFRVNPELNELIVAAAKDAGKSKSEFIRDSIVEFVKFLEMSIGVEADLMKYARNPGEDGKKRFDEFVILV